MRGVSSRMSAPVMTDSTFRFRDLHCFADAADPRSYYFLPLAADLQRDSAQRPLINLLDTGASGYVMFTATWAPRAETIDALRQEIASGHHAGSSAHIRVSFAPIASPRCDALLGDGAGTFQVIASNDTSRVPPFDALFNLAVAPDRMPQVRSAMRGEPGFLAVEYVAEVRVPVTGSATFTADAGELVPWLRHERGRGASVRALLEQAVELGLARVRANVPERLGGNTAVELFDRVLSEAAQAAPRWMASGGAGSIEVEAVVERGTPETVRAFADIGRIVASGSVRAS